jgi:voltage-gated potassium channel
MIATLGKQFRRHYLWILIGTILVVLFLLSTLVLYHFEHKVNSELTFFDAFRVVLVFFLGEYGDTPQTVVGRVISILLFIVGIMIVATLIGKIASVFVGIKMEVKVPKGIERHIIMCNWNDRGDRIIKEIHSSLAEPETEIVVITDKEINEEELRSSSAYEKVYFIRSDPTLHDVLRKARAHLAKSIIILAHSDCSDPDAMTALISLAITKLEKGLPRKPHIVAEVMNHHKIQHLLDAGVDEWVCSTDYGLGIIAQCALYGKLSEVYQQLLTYSKETNEIYMVQPDKYPSSLVGKDFRELTRIIAVNRNEENPAVLLGVKRDDKVMLNPKTYEFEVLQEGDALIVMAFDQPDLKHIENQR